MVLTGRGYESTIAVPLPARCDLRSTPRLLEQRSRFQHTWRLWLPWNLGCVAGACICEAGYAGDGCDRCESGYVRDGAVCVAGNCVDETDCSDGDPCNGEETCSDHRCQNGTPVGCGAHGDCVAATGSCACDDGWSGELCSECASGFVPVGEQCMQGTCTTNEECSDDDPCTGTETCGPDHTCAPGTPIECGVYGTCASATGTCACDPGYTGDACDACADGYVAHQAQCLPETCASDGECDDGKACNGQERCSQSTCIPGTAVVCGVNEHCEEPSATCVCDDGFEQEGGMCVVRCDVPQAPTLSIIHAGAVLAWTVPGGHPLEVGTSQDVSATTPSTWSDDSTLSLPSTNLPATVKAFARVAGANCTTSDPFAFVYEVRASYPAAAGEPGSDAVAMDDPGIVNWATEWVAPVSYGSDVDDAWKHPERAMGPAQGDSQDIVSLGRGGSIVLRFDPAISNGAGPDFAVFENGFSDDFLELGFVEVSSNGSDFVRFDAAYLGTTALGPYGCHATTDIGQLAGKYRQGFGTPFDLQVLINRPEVRNGVVDLSEIHYVRIVDIVGDGSTADSFGSPIYDPYPTTGSAGFDLEAVAVLNGG